MLVNEVLLEKPNKYDFVKDKQSGGLFGLRGKDLTFDYKGKEYKFKLVVDAAKKFKSLYRAGRGGKKSSPIRRVIKTLQAFLHKSKLDPGPIDGYYGKKTATAVVQIQREAGVAVDGDVGPNTAKAIVSYLGATIETDRIKMRNIWFKKNTKFNTYDDFIKEFKTEYLSLKKGMTIYLNDFPTTQLSSEPELRSAVADALGNAKAYVAIAQDKDNLQYDDGAWEDMIGLYKNMMLQKKFVDRVYVERNKSQQQALDKFTDKKLGKPTSTATGTRVSKGTAIDQDKGSIPSVKKYMKKSKLVAPPALKQKPNVVLDLPGPIQTLK
jgi:hypothetical protein|tara:strand:+ start:22422 stop:23393 length:972 start_codon:yes stop_codon:yes gene_type:complete